MCLLRGVMRHGLSDAGLCTGGRVQSACVGGGVLSGVFFFLSPPVGDTADTILSPKECAVHKKLKGRW